jgi:hypothetical protein
MELLTGYSKPSHTHLNYCPVELEDGCYCNITKSC